MSNIWCWFMSFGIAFAVMLFPVYLFICFKMIASGFYRGKFRVDQTKGGLDVESERSERTKNGVSSHKG